MGHPFKPLFMRDNKNRLPEALKDIVKQTDVLEGRIKPQSDDPKHVFDFPTGLRLIISREITPENQRKVHVSASRHGAALYWNDHELIKRAREYFFYLSDDIAPLEFVGMSAGHVAHFMKDDK